jgi:lauroyl/myristoyl acyltransferase
VSVVEWAYAAGWRTVRAMPRPAAAALFRAGADLAWRRRTRPSSRGIGRLASNLRRVVGPELPDAEFDQLMRAALRSYARYWMEAFRLPVLSREEILRGFRLDGAEQLAEDLAAGRGAIVALPHAGNWDLAGAWVAANDWKIITVAERLRPESLYERFLTFRRGLGMEIIPDRGERGGKPPLDVLLDRLAQGYLVPLLADRDLSARGVEVEFFGGRTRMPPGPALLALRTGAPLYALTMWYEPDAACARLLPVDCPDPDSGPLDVRVRVLTQRIADRLAEGIGAHPQDWHMLQRMWLDDPARVSTSQT